MVKLLNSKLLNILVLIFISLIKVALDLVVLGIPLYACFFAFISGLEGNSPQIILKVVLLVIFTKDIIFSNKH